MKTGEAGKIVFFTLIAGRKRKDALLSALSEQGAQLINTVYGKGTVDASYLQDVFGLAPETNKVVITCLFSESGADAAMAMLVEKFNFDRPNTGVVFTIPVDRVSF